MEPLKLDSVPDRALVLIDTAPIIYVLESHPLLGRRFEPLFEAHSKGVLKFAVTTVTLAEILVGPLRDENESLVRRYRNVLESWQLVDLNADIAERAARLRASIGLKLPDAVQAASALAVNAYAIATYDRDFSGVPALRVIS
jgi:predicted nucleic acid-binding protein